MFYVAWYGIVASAAMERVYLGLLLSAVVLIAHFYMIERRVHEALLMLIIVSVGFVIDTSLIHYGVLRFASPNPLNPDVAPFWILALYAVISTSINHSFSYIGQHMWLVAGFGAIGAPVCYFFGAKLGAAELLFPHYGSLFVLSIVWLFYLPLMFKINHWIAPKKKLK